MRANTVGRECRKYLGRSENMEVAREQQSAECQFYNFIVSFVREILLYFILPFNASIFHLMYRTLKNYFYIYKKLF